MFGKSLYRKFKDDYNESMSWAEFRQVEWGEVGLPQMMVDMVKYVSGLDMTEYLRERRERDEEKKRIGSGQDEEELEKMLEELVKKENIKEFMAWKGKIGENHYRKLLRFFRNVCSNPVQTKNTSLYLTEESFLKKLKVHFGHPCAFFASRFYSFLSDRAPLKRIYFRDFLSKSSIIMSATYRD